MERFSDRGSIPLRSIKKCISEHCMAIIILYNIYDTRVKSPNYEKKVCFLLNLRIYDPLYEIIGRKNRLLKEMDGSFFQFLLHFLFLS